MKSQITKRKSNLPAKPAELRRWILIGKVKLRAQIAAIKAIKSIEEASAATQAALEDTQDLAEELLYAEAQMGAMLDAIPDKKASSGGGTRSLPKSMTKKDSHFAQQLNRNEEVIAEVVAEAREKGEIPVRQRVLRQIAANKPKPKTPPLPKGKFDVIYADPPWEYRNSGVNGAASKHYETMSIDRLCKMPLTVVADNAVLFMWTTNPLLVECIPVIEAWGFEYKTNICWVKIGRGTYGKLGFYVSGRHELLLICTKGSFLPKYLPPSVFESEKEKHSQKPQEFYKIIERMYPDRKYIELFARNKRRGWASWGHES